jgi:hypothetical protein
MSRKMLLSIAFCFSSIFLASFASLAQKNAVVAYPAPPGLQTSPDFSVSVNNTNVWTERVGDPGMESLNVANFSCSGSQSITVTAKSAIKKYSIRQKSKNIKATVRGRQLIFTIQGPQTLYVEIDTLPHLAIFANPLEVKLSNRNDTNVVYYGPGTYSPGVINLKSNQTIYIEGGAVVNANIRGDHLQNIKILGRGILNGNLQIGNTSNIEIDGIFMRSTRGWTNTLVNCYQSVYRNVKVFSYRAIWGLDGINPVSCKNVVIDDCFIRTKDDCIAVKSMERFGGYAADDINTDSISVTNSLLVGWSHADGFTMGFEMHGGTMQNVQVKNCDILMASGQGRTGGHSGFSIVCDGPAMVQNIRFEDIRVEEQIEYKNFEIIATEGRRYGTKGPGGIKGVYLKNIQWSNPNKPFVIAGVPNSFVEDITFDNCYLNGKLLTSTKDADFQMEFAKEIKFVTKNNQLTSKK